MDEKEYLTVKDVATLVRRNEETIRRMIRARKLDVELNNNNRRQGYMITVDQLVNTWDISREDVEKYISARRAQQSALTGDERMPLGPERADSIPDEIERSAGIIAREINRIAALTGGADAGEGSGMSGDNNKWTDADGAQHEPYNNDKNYTHEYFSADFSGVGERVSDIIDGAYRQINRAVNQASAAVNAAIKQSAENAERARQQQSHTDDARNAAEYARQQQQSHTDDARNAAEHARKELESRYSAIRDSINRSRGASASDVYATGGWAESIRKLTKSWRDAAQANVNVDDDDEMDDTAIRDEFDEYVDAEAEPAPAENDNQPEQPECSAQPSGAQEQPATDYAWSDAQPTPAPEVAPERRAKLDFNIPEVGKDAMNEDGNASYQLLQAARRAVEARMNAKEAAETEANGTGEAVDNAAQSGSTIEVHAETEASGAEQPFQPAYADIAQAISDYVKYKAETPKQPDVNAKAEAAAQPADIDEAVKAEAVQLPTDDEDALKQRISSLEEQLKSMTSQLELLTRHLMSKDGDK